MKLRAFFAFAVVVVAGVTFSCAAPVDGIQASYAPNGIVTTFSYNPALDKQSSPHVELHLAIDSPDLGKVVKSVALQYGVDAASQLTSVFEIDGRYAGGTGSNDSTTTDKDLATYAIPASGALVTQSYTPDYSSTVGFVVTDKGNPFYGLTIGGLYSVVVATEICAKTAGVTRTTFYLRSANAVGAAPVGHLYIKQVSYTYSDDTTQVLGYDQLGTALLHGGLTVTPPDNSGISGLTTKPGYVSGIAGY